MTFVKNLTHLQNITHNNIYFSTICTELRKIPNQDWKSCIRFTVYIYIANTISECGKRIRQAQSDQRIMIIAQSNKS